MAEAVPVLETVAMAEGVAVVDSVIVGDGDALMVGVDGMLTVTDDEGDDDVVADLVATGEDIVVGDEEGDAGNKASSELEYNHATSVELMHVFQIATSATSPTKRSES
jgi:hypothetical protein